MILAHEKITFSLKKLLVFSILVSIVLSFAFPIIVNAEIPERQGDALQYINCPNPPCPSQGGAIEISSPFSGISSGIAKFLTDTVVGWVSEITGVLVWIGGTLFDWVGYITLQGDTYKSNIVTETWKIARDLVNIFLIFIVIYIGIRTILGISSGESQKLLVRIVIIALLINFSLVFTGIIIDAGNILALSFYEAFPDRTYFKSLLPDGADKSLSAPFAKSGGLSEFIGGENLYAEWFEQQSAGFITISTILVTFIRIVVNVIAAFVLFAAAILLIIRTVVLIFMMVLSPVGLVSFILPETRSMGDRWLRTLIDYTLFAPAFLALYYVAARIYTSDIVTNIGSGGSTVVEVTLTSLFLKLILTSAALILSIVMAKRLSLYGGSKAVRIGKRWSKNTGKRAGGAVAQGTLGAGARAALQTKTAQDLKTTRTGRLLLRPLEAAQVAAFGGKKGGYKKRTEDKTERLEKTHTELLKPRGGETKEEAKARAEKFKTNISTPILGINALRGEASKNAIKNINEKKEKKDKRDDLAEKEIGAIETRGSEIDTELGTLGKEIEAVEQKRAAAKTSRIVAQYTIALAQLRGQEQNLKREKGDIEQKKARADIEQERQKDLDERLDDIKKAADDAKKSSGDGDRKDKDRDRDGDRGRRRDRGRDK